MSWPPHGDHQLVQDTYAQPWGGALARSRRRLAAGSACARACSSRTRPRLPHRPGACPLRRRGWLPRELAHDARALLGSCPAGSPSPRLDATRACRSRVRSPCRSPTVPPVGRSADRDRRLPRGREPCRTALDRPFHCATGARAGASARGPVGPAARARRDGPPSRSRRACAIGLPRSFGHWARTRGRIDPEGLNRIGPVASAQPPVGPVQVRTRLPLQGAGGRHEAGAPEVAVAAHGRTVTTSSF